MTEAAHELDLLLAEKKNTQPIAGTSFGDYCIALQRLGELKTQLKLQHQITENGDQLITYLSLTLLDAENNPQLQRSREWVAECHRKAADMVYQKML